MTRLYEGEISLTVFLKIGPLYTKLSHSTHCIFY